MSVKHDVKFDVSDDLMDNWQGMVDILAEMLSIPAALIMRYIEPDIEVFVSSNSEGNPYHPGDSETLINSGLYCETVIKTQNKLLVPNALADEHWKNNPDIKLNMISYLGFPICSPDKQPFGTICVLDTKSNSYSNTVEMLMLKFRNMIEFQLEMVYMNQSLGDKNKQLIDYLMELQALRGMVPICSSCKSIRDKDDSWHPIEEYLIKNPEAKFSHSICPDCKKKLYPELTSSNY